MSLITYNGLVKLVEDGVIENVDPDCIGPASIDIRLGDALSIEHQPRHLEIVDLYQKRAPQMNPLALQSGSWLLYPGDFALAGSMEIFHLPDDIAFEYKLNSSGARAGLNHLLAGWADPGFNNASLTLELHNVLRHHVLKLTPGMRIGQCVFWRGERVPADRSYRAIGRYNGQRGATPSKGV